MVYTYRMSTSRKIIFALIGIVIILIIIIIVVSRSHTNTSPAVKNAIVQNHLPFANVMINGTGDSRLFGVVLDSRNGSVITAKGTLNNSPTSFTINTDNNTTVHRQNATSSLNQLQSGDILMITGSFQSFTPTLTFDAHDIKTFGSINPGVHTQVHTQVPSTSSTNSGQATTTSIRKAPVTTTKSKSVKR